jgi:integrase
VVAHRILGGKVKVYRRNRSGFWQCSGHFNNQRYRISTKEDNLELAKEFAESWYLELRGKARAGLLKTEKTFREIAEEFKSEYRIITEGQRSPRWVEGHEIRLRLHLIPFFGDMPISEITPGKVQQYRAHRISTSPAGKPPARSTLHDEVVTLRQTMKTAIRYGWLAHLPDFSPPYRTQGKIVHRPWFSPEEYKQLYKATGDYARSLKTDRHRWNAEQVHDFVLFLANTGLRPDEAKNLQHRDIEIVKDKDTDETILEIEVRGKRGVGYCKSMPGAVWPYERLRSRLMPTSVHKRHAIQGLEEPNGENEGRAGLPGPTDPVFPGNHIKLFNGILRRARLKFDRDGKPRTAYSLRHTYICLRLMEGADIYQLAKNCRTSVEMIEKFYAAHLKNTIDASSINVRKNKHSKPMATGPVGGNRSQKPKTAGRPTSRKRWTSAPGKVRVRDPAKKAKT